MAEYETTAETAAEENAFPGLTAIGRAFAGAITYINAQDHTDLQTETRSWLISCACGTMHWLRGELEMLRVNKTHLLDSRVCDYMAQFLRACGLDAKVSFSCVALYNPPIRIGIRFPQAVKGVEESAGREIIVFDGDFQKEFFGLVSSLRIEG